ncbi:MAG: hypothetical protein H6667_15775 [Ardenticatenaceae bacterium]|nr:hypothetical protein [Ardenticatenaceae bacterium]
MQTDTSPPTTQFDWQIYADATFAGLSLLIPIPLLDVAFEWFFRRRMARTIARLRGDGGRSLSPAVIQEINRDPDAWWQGCLMAPFKLFLLFLKRLSRKLLYFLTVKEATDQLNFYWHRAFLLDHMVQRGDLDSVETAVPALQAMHIILKTHATSPLVQLAAQILDNVSHVLRTIFRWLRRGREDEVVQTTRQTMAAHWLDFAAYFAAVAQQYDALVTAVPQTPDNQS